ncbi:hypothetical protein CEE45_16255 [Candidatus Heimdallarchaeota archaeon B3_Heim]|nr:MAG: hypothetical protein CEE45_16255 [Candidatus Heimdallarchaeota archaeon B3_Heim]
MALDDLTKKRILKEGGAGILLTIIVVFSGIFIASDYFGELLIPGTKGEDPLYTIPGPIKTSFGTYVPYEASLNFTPILQPYTIDSDLSNVVNYNPSNSFFEVLTGEAKSLLVQNGFVVIPSDYQQIYDIYTENEESGIPSFVTTDAVLHAYHVLYDNALRSIEGDIFWFLLRNLTINMMDVSRTQYLHALSEGNSPNVEEAARKNLAFFSIAQTLLDPMSNSDPLVETLVAAELALIEAHSTITSSPLFGYLEDYSQYKPRGHYTRTEKLEQFFKAMMWYGRMSFRLNPSDNRGMNETRQAVLIALGIAQLEGNIDYWSDIYEPTVFFVGSADDLIYSDYLEMIGKVLTSPVELETVENNSVIEKIIQEGLLYRNPRILSSVIPDTQDASNETKGLRFMGQRFIPDSYIFQKLVHDSVRNRLFPTALDIFAVFGSNRSKELLTEEAALYPDYLPKRNELETEYALYNLTVWTQNLYWLWLYSLTPLLNPKGTGYPTYMQTPAWVDKELITALGSWTELRHDTILYAKQSYTKFVSMPPEPEQGYVEANPELFARLASLASLTFEGLSSRSLMPDIINNRLTLLLETLFSLTEITIKELENKPLKSSEVDLIENIGYTLEGIVNINESVYYTDTDSRMALVADVHTDPYSEKVLEEGVGNPFVIFTVNEVNGELILSRGAIFSYYEFEQPLAERLTDETWQEILDQGNAIPELPSWVESFIATDKFISQATLYLLTTPMSRFSWKEISTI